ncbi:MAG: hypothetical protein ACQEXG_13940 [Pseudomonadota bacterium]
MRQQINNLAMGSILALSASVALAETVDVQVERLMIAQPATPTDADHKHMTFDLWISLPGIASLGDEARVVSLTDDQGNDLLEIEGSPQALFGFDPADNGFLMQHQVESNLEEGWLRVPVFSPDVPHRQASSIRMELELDLLLASDDVRRVRVENVDFTDVPGWGVDLDVDGHTMTCRDDRRERPEDQPLELSCFLRGDSLLGITVPDQDETPEPSHPEANLVVVGDRSDVTLEVTLPVTLSFQQDVQLEFGLGLGS